MTTPATREDVVELMARAVRDGGWHRLRARTGPKAMAAQEACRGNVADLLAVLEAAGVCLVPAKATEQMEEDIEVSQVCEFDAQALWADVLLSSPYKKEPTG